MKFSRILLVGALVIGIIPHNSFAASFLSSWLLSDKALETIETLPTTMRNFSQETGEALSNALTESSAESILFFGQTGQAVVKQNSDKLAVLVPYWIDCAAQYVYNEAKPWAFYALGAWSLLSAKNEFYEAFKRWRKLDPEEQDRDQKRVWSLIWQNLKWGTASLTAGVFLFYFGKDLAACLLNYNHKLDFKAPQFPEPEPMPQPTSKKKTTLKKSPSIYEVLKPERWVPSNCAIELPKAA